MKTVIYIYIAALVALITLAVIDIVQARMAGATSGRPLCSCGEYMPVTGDRIYLHEAPVWPVAL